MNPLLMHFTSGNSLFSGVLLLISGVALSFWKKDSLILRVSINLLLSAGVIFLWVSSVPFILKTEWLILLLIIIFIILFHFKERVQEKWLYFFQILILALAFIFVICEVPNFICPNIPGKSFKRMYLLGDSISGGTGFRGEKTWHECIAEKYNIEVKSYTIGGGRVSSMFFDAKRIKDEKALILLEIGGNDILRGTTPQKYEEDLEELLKIVVKPGRTVVMFGLPLPPFYPDFGVIQKKLSKKYGVILIPRRYFAAMLSGSENSVDGLHLSNAGHARMGDMTWEILKPLFGRNSSE